MRYFFKMTFFTFCNDASQGQILHKIRHLILLINQTRWIIEAYVSDFYTHKHWEGLTSTVQEYIDATEPPDWAWLLDQNYADAPKPSKKIIPLSLLALKSCTQSLSLERTAIDLHQAETIQSMIDVLQYDSSSKKTCSDESILGCRDMCETATKKAAPFQKPNYKNGQCMDMQHIFRKHVKPKKQHEIQQLGQIIHVLSQKTKCNSVIDVGAGLGHLSRLLTFSHGLKVTTIEAADGHAPKAAEFDRELKKDVLKKLKKETVISSTDSKNQVLTEDTLTQTQKPSSSSSSILQNPDSSSEISVSSNTNAELRNKFQDDKFQEENLPSHVVCYLQPDIASTQFVEILRKTKCLDKGAELQSDSDDDDFILAGLHTCGDLAPTLLKVFLNCPAAVALASVGCCYMKIDACLEDERSSSDGAVLENYPMSSFLREQRNHTLNYESREMACHFADAYCERLKDNPIHLKIHSYRAALQYLIKTMSPDYASGQKRLVCKKGAQVSFPQYASEVLKKLDIDEDSVPSDLMQQCEMMTLTWKRVVAFYTLRLSLAPVVEAVILLDRVLFLKELGINSALVPIFDSRLSPRNFALVAIKC